MRWWSSAQAQVLQGNVCSSHRPLTSKLYFSAAKFLLPLCLSCMFSHTCFCRVPSSLLPHRLLIPNAPSSHCLSLFDSTFSPAFPRLFVPAVFQLLILCCLLFLASLLSQPSNAWSVAPMPSFKPHVFLSRFLLQSSTAPAQWFIPSTPRYEKREPPSFPVSSSKSGVTESLAKIWSLGYVHHRPHRQNLTESNKHQEIWS